MRGRNAITLDRRLVVGIAAFAALAPALWAGRAEAAVTSYFDPSFGNVFISGDAADDPVTVACSNGFVTINGAQAPAGVTCASVRGFGINTAAGNDSINTSAVGPTGGYPNLRGGGGPHEYAIGIGAEAGNDTLVDGPSRVVFDGAEGADFALGGEGNDQLLGSHLANFTGAGGDVDVLFGEGGDDLIHGSPGDDRLFGGDGADRVFGNDGLDLIRAGPGRDQGDGGRGADEVFGEAGRDTLRGGRNPDELRGGRGRDTAFGEQGRDLCRAEREFDCER
jgi:Ca2+-binding RTX toxin-like protein